MNREDQFRNEILHNPGNDGARVSLAIYLQDEADKPAEARLLGLMMALSGGENIPMITGFNDVSTNREQMVAAVEQIFKDYPSLQLNREVVTTENHYIEAELNSEGGLNINIAMRDAEARDNNLTISEEIRELFLYPVKVLSLISFNLQSADHIDSESLNEILNLAQGTKEVILSLNLADTLGHIEFQNLRYPRLESLILSSRSDPMTQNDGIKAADFVGQSPKIRDIAISRWNSQNLMEELLGLANKATPHLNCIEMAAGEDEIGNNVIEALARNLGMPRLKSIVFGMGDLINVEAMRARLGIQITDGVIAEAERRAASSQVRGY